MNMEEATKEFLGSLLDMLKWLLITVVTGVLVGFVGVGFGKCMNWALGIRAAHHWVLYLLPVGGVVIIGMYRALKVYNPRGTNLVLASIHSGEELPIYMAPLIFISTIITHLVGGSAGREGAALQFGGSIGNQIGRWLKLDEKDRNIVIMCGMSAAFSALFGTPLAAAVFPLEVVSVGIMHYSALLPCMVSSIIADQVALWFHMAPEAFAVDLIPALTIKMACKVGLLAICCAVISMIFCSMLHQAGAFFKNKIRVPYVKALIGGSIVLAAVLLLGTEDYCGAGIGVIERALEGDVRPEAFLVKMVLTAITLGCGYKGGEIVPSLFVGGTFGAFFAGAAHMPTALAGACGMAAVFCGVTNCPISTLLISFELFGFDGMLYYALAVSISYMISGYYGLYHDQKIVYSKLRPEYINRKTK